MGRKRISDRDDNIKLNCPHCGSRRTGKVDLTNYYCLDCGDIEFTKSGRVYYIMPDGNLVEYNEFMDCG